MQKSLEVAFAEDQPIASIISQWAHGCQIDRDQIIGSSQTFHSEDIRVGELVDFLMSDFCMSKSTLKTKKVFIKHRRAIMDLAQGQKDMWDKSLPSDSHLRRMRDYWAKPYVLPIFSSTHRTEKAVGDIRNTATNNSTESTRSSVAIARQWQTSRVNEELKGQGAVNDSSRDEYTGRHRQAVGASNLQAAEVNVEEDDEEHDDDDDDDDDNKANDVTIQDGFTRYLGDEVAVAAFDDDDSSLGLHFIGGKAHVKPWVLEHSAQHRRSTTKPFLKWHKNRRVRGARRNEALINVVSDLDREIEQLLLEDDAAKDERDALIEYFTTRGGMCRISLLMI